MRKIKEEGCHIIWLKLQGVVEMSFTLVSYATSQMLVQSITGVITLPTKHVLKCALLGQLKCFH